MILFGIEIRKARKEQEKTPNKGAEARKQAAWEKIERALEEIDKRQLNFTEYQIRKLSGVSINTVKKHREEIAAWRENKANTLF